MPTTLFGVVGRKPCSTEEQQSTGILALACDRRAVGWRCGHHTAGERKDAKGL